MTRLWMKSTMSCVDVPGRKISAMPDCLRAGISASGMMPPTSTVTSFMPLSCSRLISCGQSVLCAPERIERPMTSTSSCTAPEALISGACRRPALMNSMPASRSARAIIFAPRSCPSSPGLAIKTRIFLSGIFNNRPASGDGDFFVGAEDGAHGVAEFAESGITFHGVEEVRHEVFLAFRGLAKRIEAALDFVVGALGAELGEAFGLAMRHRVVNLQSIERLLLGHEIVHAHHDFLFFVQLALVAIGSFGNFALRIAAFEGRDTAAP